MSLKTCGINSASCKTKTTGLFNSPPPFTSIEPDICIPPADLMQNGTKSNQYIIHVDVEHPERNNGFEILCAPGEMHSHYEYKVIDIRRQIDLGDK
eukprot:9199475-Ditylum_brightwellii.AAC.1